MFFNFSNFKQVRKTIKGRKQNKLNFEDTVWVLSKAFKFYKTVQSINFYTATTTFDAEIRQFTTASPRM